MKKYRNKPILKMATNSSEYFEFIRKLRNDPMVKRGFIKQSYISAIEQEAYMKKYCNNYHVCICNKKPVGYVGVINGDIRVAVHPDFQHQGVALFMINFIRIKYKKLQAKIKIDNSTSIKLFKKAGFELKYYIYE